MAAKSKFQINRSLDERIRQISENVIEYEPELSQVDKAFILGFHCANVTNYVCLTTDYKLHHAGNVVVGIAYFKSSPNDNEISAELAAVNNFNNSPDGLSSPSADQNSYLFLVYTQDDQTKQMIKKIFDSKAKTYASEQPKLSVLDVSKIYNHSAIVKINFDLRLDIFQESGDFLNNDTLEATLNETKKLLDIDPEEMKLSMERSNYTTTSAKENKNPTESLYDYLDTPDDIAQMGDYLPQLSNEEKSKMVDKWRNKVKAQRDPLEFRLDHEILSCISERDSKRGAYDWQLEIFTHLHANDSVSKSMKRIVYVLRNRIDLARVALLDKADGGTLEPGDLVADDFDEIRKLGSIVPAVYCIPQKSTPNFETLLRQRRQMHLAYLLPLQRPHFRHSQRILGVDLLNSDQKAGYLCDVHVDLLDKSGIKGGTRNVVEGTYTYHHYLQDRASDTGWGCAYRSLQTIISWFKHQGYIYSADCEISGPTTKSNQADEKKTARELAQKLHREQRVPTHTEIQQVLVDVGDKQANFVGSEKWIGSQEVCYVLSHLYNLESKFISVSSGNELVYKARDLGQHFGLQSTPVMIGGGVLAHTIIGVDFNEKNGDISYLVLDPHYTGAEDLATITKKGWCGWKKNAFWDKGAFYNLCLPQRPAGCV